MSRLLRGIGNSFCWVRFPETTSADAFERHVGGNCLRASRGKAWHDIKGWIIAPVRSVDMSVSVSVRLALACLISALAESTHGQPLLLKTKTFDADPGWDGRNNRATDPAPRQIVQNFGFSGSSSNAGGSAGEIGGFITPAGEPAFYGKVITPTSFNDPLSASGILNQISDALTNSGARSGS